MSNCVFVAGKSLIDLVASRLSHRALLRPRHQRPCRRRAEPCDEIPPVHSITSSARTRIEDGTSRLSALAVLAFNVIVNLTGS